MRRVTSDVVRDIGATQFIGVYQVANSGDPNTSAEGAWSLELHHMRAKMRTIANYLSEICFAFYTIPPEFPPKYGFSKNGLFTQNFAQKRRPPT